MNAWNFRQARLLALTLADLRHSTCYQPALARLQGLSVEGMDVHRRWPAMEFEPGTNVARSSHASDLAFVMTLKISSLVQFRILRNHVHGAIDSVRQNQIPVLMLP